MTDAIIASARYVVGESLKELRATIEGLPGKALDWRPAGPETNSMAVLTAHVLHSTRSWLSVALGAPLPERDRESEFRASASDTAALLRLVDEMSADCRRLLDSVEEVDWSATRRTHVRSGRGVEEVPAAFALLHAVEHLREHVAHASLTRQLWEASHPTPGSPEP